MGDFGIAKAGFCESAGLRSARTASAHIQVLACTIAVAKTQIGTFATKGLLCRRRVTFHVSPAPRPYYLSPELCQEKPWPHPTHVGMWTCARVCPAFPGNTTFLRTFGQWDAFCTSPALASLQDVEGIYVLAVPACGNPDIRVPRLCARKVPFDAPNIPGLVREIA